MKLTPPTTRIGGRSATGAIRIGPDAFVSDWVWKGAPFAARLANAESNGWRIDDKDGKLIALNVPEAEAQERVDNLNMLAAAAQLLKE